MKNKSRIVIYLILIALFNVIFFMVGGGNRNASIWIGYAFVYVALIVSFSAPLFCINYKRVPENLMPIYGFAWAYMIISIIMNSVFFIIDINNLKMVLISNLILLVIYIINFIINFNVNTTVEKQLETVDAEREFIKNASNNIKSCMNRISDQKILKNVERAYDIVRTSPLHSNENAVQNELDILKLTDLLKSAVSANDNDEIIRVSQEIVIKIEDRNMLIK